MLVGSAEPLSPAATKQRLQELADWGVDLSLIQANLARTPTERIEHMLALLHLVMALRQGYQQQAPHHGRAEP